MRMERININTLTDITIESRWRLSASVVASRLFFSGELGEDKPQNGHSSADLLMSFLQFGQRNELRTDLLVILN